MKGFGVFFFILAAAGILFSCKADKGKLLVDTWKMEEDSTVVFQLNEDSTFTYITLEGKWDISEDGKWLILKDIAGEPEGTTKNLEIITLAGKRMVLSNNGEELIFVGAK